MTRTVPPATWVGLANKFSRATCQTGNAVRHTDPAVTLPLIRLANMVASEPVWETTTLLGRPVVPDV
jgi:hypothetical protein